MTTTLTATVFGDPYTSTPLLVLGLQSTFTGQNIFHTTLAGGMDVTYIPAALRSGTLDFLYATEDEAATCAGMHVYGAVIQMTDDDRQLATFAYVVNGSVTVTLDDETRELWKVSVDFQEVQP